MYFAELRTTCNRPRPIDSYARERRSVELKVVYLFKFTARFANCRVIGVRNHIIAILLRNIIQFSYILFHRFEVYSVR